MPDPVSAQRRVQIGAALCDLDRLTLEVEGERTRLEPRLAGLLGVFIQRPGETLSRDELLALVWDEDGSDEALTQAVSRLRKLLRDRALIETVPRVGYRLAVHPIAAPDDAPQTSSPRGAKASSTVSNRNPVLSAPWRTRAGLAVLAALAGAVLSWLVFGRQPPVEREFEIQMNTDDQIEFIPQSEADQDETPPENPL